MLINDNWKIESDSLNVTIYHRAKGKKAWKPAGYFRTIKDALNELIDQEIKGTGLKDLETVVSKINDLQTLLERLPEPLQ